MTAAATAAAVSKIAANAANEQLAAQASQLGTIITGLIKQGLDPASAASVAAALVNQRTAIELAGSNAQIILTPTGIDLSRLPAAAAGQLSTN